MNTQIRFCTLHLPFMGSLVLLLLSSTQALAATENLDQAMLRKSRQSLVAWPAQELENSSKLYTWQPETLMYSDITTGKEVWVLIHAPDRSEIYSMEHGSNVWSYDGSRIGFFSPNRPTYNPALSANTYHYRWLVNTDGSGLRSAEGYGRRDIPFDSFGWAHTELAYYAFGSGAGEKADSTYLRFFKNTVNASNQVTGSLVLDTSSVDSAKKHLVKEGVSTDDSHAVFFVTDSSYAALTNTPNPIASTKLYFAQLGQSAGVTNAWGIARHVGPSTNNWADPYGNLLSSSEVKFHDAWSPGPTGSWAMGQYSGGSTVFVTFNKQGSAADGGPLWEDWNGNSYGKGEVQVVSSGDEPPKNPYGLPYFGHPTFDRWGKYAFHGTYTDTPKPGTRVTDMVSHAMLPNYPFSYGVYDGQHHTWSGWTDNVAAVNPVAPYFLQTNKYTADYTSAEKIADTHLLYVDNYNAYPRPSQSPDGTKIAYSSTFLNNSTDDYPFIQWAVAYYPYPPQLTGAALSSGNIRLAWDFRQSTATPRTYTRRGWPSETNDMVPSPREITAFRAWVSSDGVEFTPVSGVIPYGNRGGKWTETSWSKDILQMTGTTRYYGITSLEHSGLESRTLSNIWKVVTDPSGAVVSALESTPYPANPGGKTTFELHIPPAPKLLGAVRDAALPNKYRLSWEDPPALYETIRYYNIYYSTAGIPDAIQQNRIASVPKGINSFLDWNADGAQEGYYRITSVDTQGNEGLLTAPDPPGYVEGVYLP